MTTTAPNGPKFSAASVTRAPDRTPHKFILTGRSGAGKTFFTSTIPRVFIVPVEEGLKGASPDHEPAHFASTPRTLRELHEALDAVIEINTPKGDAKERDFKHVVIDSLSGIEALVHAAALESEKSAHMEAKDYKKIWSAAEPLWTSVQRKLDLLRHRAGVHVWVIAHSAEVAEAATNDGTMFRKWDLSLKGSGQTGLEVRQMWRAWADHVFFLDWLSEVQSGGKGKRAMGKYKGRMLYTKESATHYAKSRSRLPVSLPASWDDLDKALRAGSAQPEAKVRAEIEALLPRLSEENRKEVTEALAAAKGSNALAALLSRAQGMFAIHHEDDEQVEAPAADEPAESAA